MLENQPLKQTPDSSSFMPIPAFPLMQIFVSFKIRNKDYPEE